MSPLEFIFEFPVLELLRVGITNLLRIFLLKEMLEIFLVKKKQNRKINRFFYGIYYLVTVSLLAIFPEFEMYEVGCMVGLFGIAFLYRERWREKLWVLFTILGIDYASWLIVFCVTKKDYLSYDRLLQSIFATALLLLCTVILKQLHFPNQPFLLKGGEDMRLDRKLAVMLLVIPLVSILILTVIFYNGKQDVNLILFIALGVLFILMSIFYLYYILFASYVHLQERDLYCQQTHYYQNQLEVIEESRERVRCLRHDMKNHILELQALVKQNKAEEILSYLEQMEDVLINPAEFVATGNEDIDSLLNYKLQRAKELLKEVEVSIHIPEKMSIHSFDLNVILGNLLDNAVEAAVQTEEQRVVFQMKVEKGLLLIHVENSRNCGEMLETEKSFLSEKQKGLYGMQTTKADRENHGIGLSNVKRIVEKYDGELEIICEDTHFEVDLLLYAGKI